MKTAMTFCVILAGVCAAMLFRHDRQRPAATAPGVEEELLLRYRTNASAPNQRQRGAGRDAATLQYASETPANPRPATVVTPLDRREPPPSLSPDYPETKRPASSHWGVSMDMMLPVSASANQAARTHRVVDGDTLEALADRYLGSSARAEEIYAANRESLHDPKLLPIGVELKLPPLTPPKTAAQ